MANVVRMPEIATGAEGAGVQSWLVARGDSVKIGQAIVEIETEKAVVEHESEYDGVFAGELLPAGSETAVGAPIAVIAEQGEDLDSALDSAHGTSETTSDSEARTAATPTPPQGTAEEAVHTLERDSSSTDESTSASRSKLPEEVRLFASPLVRRIVKEQGLDLTAIKGTGPHGRIVRRDVQSFGTTAESLQKSSAEPEAMAQSQRGSAPEEGETTSDNPAAPFTEVPHSGMRKAIARRLTESKATVPHFYLAADCRMDALLALRGKVNELENTRISVNDFVVKAVAGALSDVPEANAIWTDTAIQRFKTVDIAVAVSVPDGLLTPVVRGVERLSLGGLSTEILDLAQRAREGKIRQRELEGGSFSVSNLGMYGTSEFAAILNPPQSGILAVGAAQKRPVVNEEGELDVATMMTVTLSADHRVIDGALAAQWLQAFKNRIESPMSLLI